MDIPLSLIQSLDELARPSLISARSEYFAWLLAFTFLVGLGVVMEGPEIFHELRESISKYRRRVRRPTLVLSDRGLPFVKPEAIRREWIPIISLMGWILVAAGVVGEYKLDGKVSEFDSTLQAIDNELLAQAKRDTGAAGERAGDAIRQSAVLQRDSAQLRKDAVRLQRDVEDAKLAAKNADLARVQLQARIAPRTFDLGEREAIGRALHNIAARLFARKVSVTWSLLDPEATVFAVEINDALRRGNIQTTLTPTGINVPEDFKMGISITGPSRDLDIVRAIVTALHSFPTSNRLIEWETDNKYNGRPITIVVSVKPPLDVDTLGPNASLAWLLPPHVIPPTVDRKLDNPSDIARTLVLFAGTGIILARYSADLEATALEAEIERPLGAARWIRSEKFIRPDRPLPIPLIGPRIFHGIVVTVEESATTRDKMAADWLVRELRGDGGLVVQGPFEQKPSGIRQAAPITITIGRKP